MKELKGKRGVAQRHSSLLGSDSFRAPSLCELEAFNLSEQRIWLTLARDNSTDVVAAEGAATGAWDNSHLTEMMQSCSAPRSSATTIQPEKRVCTESVILSSASFSATAMMKRKDERDSRWQHESDQS